MLLDPQGVILDWLCGAEKIFGYGAPEVRGRHFSLLFVAEDIARGLPELELAVARRDSTSEDDRWHARKDGAHVWVSGTVNALQDAAGLHGFIKIMRDRTDLRMQSEAGANQLVLVQDTLERTRTFTHTLGHELLTPLTPMRIASHIARQATAEPKVVEASRIIESQIKVMERIANDLADVTRLEHRKLEMRVSQFDVRELLEREAGAHAEAFRAKGLQLDTILPDEPLLLAADAVRVQQALANLLSNALKYTPAGGRVWLKATQEAQETVIRVEDTGIGIAADVLPRIFELFTQEPGARDFAPGGLGIGLAVVSQIAALHGGVAQARSAGTGKGAEFTLRLPSNGLPP
nr:PAS domain-containing sensor histidine kinase [Caenimonas aquaedulcis]